MLVIEQAGFSPPVCDNLSERMTPAWKKPLKSFPSTSSATRCSTARTPGATRRELVTRLIEESGAAIVGVQELMPAMKEDIRRLLTDYSIFGWGRARKRTNEHAAILVHEPD